MTYGAPWAPGAPDDSRFPSQDVYVYVYVCMYMYLSLSIYIYMYIYIYVYVYIHIYDMICTYVLLLLIILSLPHKICSKGWVAQTPFLIGSFTAALRCSKGWVRKDLNLVMGIG